MISDHSTGFFFPESTNRKYEQQSAAKMKSSSSLRLQHRLLSKIMVSQQLLLSNEKVLQWDRHHPWTESIFHSSFDFTKIFWTRNEKYLWRIIEFVCMHKHFLHIFPPAIGADGCNVIPSRPWMDMIDFLFAFENLRWISHSILALLMCFVSGCLSRWSE